MRARVRARGDGMVTTSGADDATSGQWMGVSMKTGLMGKCRAGDPSRCHVHAPGSHMEYNPIFMEKFNKSVEVSRSNSAGVTVNVVSSGNASPSVIINPNAPANSRVTAASATSGINAAHSETPRTALVRRTLDPMDTEEQLHPFWDYRQTVLDKSAIRWTARTTLDGRLGGLYLQLPYGYQHDVLKDEDSVILHEVADSMRESGHEDWAATVDNDVVMAADWRSANNQTIGLAYDEDYELEPDIMQQLALYEPYGITPFNVEYMNRLSSDEMASMGARTITEGDPLKGKRGYIIAIVAIAAGIAFSSTAVLWLAAGVAAGASAIDINVRRIRSGKRLESVSETMAVRPGYIMETDNGWVCWQYDDSNATPRRLASAARIAVNRYIVSKYGGRDSAPRVKSTAVSSDGRMVWFQSDKPLTSTACHLSPVDAQRYLSLYVKHQHHDLETREYDVDEPIIISSTMSTAASMNGAMADGVVSSVPLDGTAGNSIDDSTDDSVGVGREARNNAASDDGASVLKSRMDDRLKNLETQARELESAMNRAGDNDERARTMIDAALRLASADISGLSVSDLAMIDASIETGIDGLMKERDRLFTRAEHDVSMSVPLVMDSAGNGAPGATSASDVDKRADAIADNDNIAVNPFADLMNSAGVNPNGDADVDENGSDDTVSSRAQHHEVNPFDF